MSTSKNKAAARRLFEVWNNGNVSILPELISPDVVFRTTTPEIKGLEGFKHLIDMFRIAFPDLHQSIDHIVAEGDMVAIFYIFEGTLKGELFGGAPTGKKCSVPSCTLSRFEGSKAVETWEYYDKLATFQQLGIPIPAQ
jgi:predicted ester cyclase